MIKLFENFNKKYYHGCKTLQGEMILKDGYIKPGNTDTIRGNKLTPIMNRTYVTPSIREACIYAIGGVLLGHQIYGKKDGYFGYIFEVDINDKKILADEDYVGYAIYLCFESLKFEMNGQNGRLKYYNYDPHDTIINWRIQAKKEYLQFAKDNLTKLQFDKCIKYNDYGDFSVAGKKLIKVLPERMNQWLLDANSSGSVEGNLKIINYWKIDYEHDVIKLKEDGSNFFDIIKKINI